MPGSYTRHSAVLIGILAAGWTLVTAGQRPKDILPQ